MTPSDAVERYLFTGEHDPAFPAWSGRVAARRRVGGEVLRGVLARVVEHRARRAPLRARRAPDNAAAIVRERTSGLLRGLLGPDEAAHLEWIVPERVVVIDVDSFAIIANRVCLDTAWRLANVLLDDVGAPPLSDDTPTLDGVCAHGRAWVTGRAFAPPGPFADVLAHEVAHLLHDLNRGDVQLTPAGQPVIAVPPLARETFAYAAEVWSCVVRSAPDQASRREQVATYLADHLPVDFRVDPARLGAALRAAAEDPVCGWRHVKATSQPAAIDQVLSAS
jgi:hypothetical protein